MEAEYLDPSEVPSLMSLMLYQAVMAGPGEDVEKALEVVVFARDLTRHPSFIHGIMASRTASRALVVFELLLGRPQPPSADRRVVEVLGALGDVDIRRALTAERLSLGVTLAASFGRRVSEQTPPSVGAQGLSSKEDWREMAFRNAVVLDRE